MEITELNIISDFEAGMTCLQNPSLISRFFSRSGLGSVPQVYRFWKWGALILALVATLSGVITRIQLLIVRFWKLNLLPSPDFQNPNPQFFDSDSDSDDEEDSSASSDDEGYEPTTSFSRTDEEFRVAGSRFYNGDNNLRLRRRRSGGRDRCWWPDFAAGGKSVVKLWDNLGLGFDFEEDDSESVVSVWDSNKDLKISSFTGERRQIPAMSTSSPAVFFTDGLYDMRIGNKIPAIHADWMPRRGTVVGIDSGEVRKVYVRDDDNGELTVGDMRNVKTMLENLTESDGDTWWDADAVIVSDELVDDTLYWDVTQS